MYNPFENLGMKAPPPSNPPPALMNQAVFQRNKGQPYTPPQPAPINYQHYYPQYQKGYIHTQPIQPVSTYQPPPPPPPVATQPPPPPTEPYPTPQTYTPPGYRPYAPAPLQNKGQKISAQHTYPLKQPGAKLTVSEKKKLKLLKKLQKKQKKLEQGKKKRNPNQTLYHEESTYLTNNRGQRFRQEREQFEFTPMLDPLIALPTSGKPVVGTSTDLEKEYYRIQETDLSKIRPEHVLTLSLALLEKQWKERQLEYLTVCNRMKAIRQDLTVQKIRNSFSVQVYESHARIALENKDFAEFNQCQTKLKSLYDENPGEPNEMEFTAYRLLYRLFDGSQDHSLFLQSAQELTKAQCDDRSVQYSLKLCTSFYSSNFSLFFKLVREGVPYQGISVVNLYLTSIRNYYIKIIGKTYRGTLSLSWVSLQLGFTDTNAFKLFIGNKGTYELTDGEEYVILDVKKL